MEAKKEATLVASKEEEKKAGKPSNESEKGLEK